MRNKLKKNRVNGSHINSTWSSDPNTIKKEVFKFFSEKFHEPCPNMPKLILLLFKCMNPDQISSQEIPFSFDEIKPAVWGCGFEKALRPDGYMFNLIKKKNGASCRMIYFVISNISRS